MKIVNFLLSALALIFLLMAMCAKPNYNNPLDRGGTNFAGDGPAGDLDNDGIANMFDPDAPPEYRQHSTPSITLLGPDTIIIAQYDPKHLTDGLQTMATATDPLYGNLDSNIVMTGDFFTSQCNTYTLTYTVHNMANDIATKQRVVIVDCEGPVITLNGINPMEINVGKPYNEPGATAYDSVDRQTKTVAISNAPNTASGSMRILWA